MIKENLEKMVYDIAKIVIEFRTRSPIELKNTVEP